VNSILTSRSPLAFVGTELQDFSIPASIPSLATILSARGFSTAAVSASPIVRATPTPENPRAGFGNGFGVFDETCYWSDAGCITRVAIRQVATLPEPFLLYAHYLDPHDPYRLPEGVKPRFSDDREFEESRAFIGEGDPNPIARRMYEQGRAPRIAPDELGYLIDRYDDEIHFLDRQLMRLIHELDRRGLTDRTVLAIVSDHGESFLEHEHLKHCRSLYESEIRVPMVFLVPALPARRVGAPATNLDLLPTLLDLLGIDESGAGFEGRSLRALLLGRRPRGAPSVTYQRAWWGSERAVSDGRFKLIGIADSPPATTPHHLRLFDLQADPEERVEVRERHALGRLRSEMADWMRLEPTPGPAAADEVERRLRSLGYLQ
jgi:arylsulfatase A-like enzyme